jgi:hypothetical protein
MQPKTCVFAAALAAIVFATESLHPLGIAPAYAGCPTGVRIDSSTAADATRKLEAQGYRNVRDLKKGCDNFWYGYASKGGQEQHVSLSPGGEVQLQHE